MRLLSMSATIILGLAVAFPAWAASSDIGASAWSGKVSSSVEFGAALQMDDAFKSGGMTEVSTVIQKCYMQIVAGTISPLRAQMCILIDITAVGSDQWFRERMSGMTGHEPPPTTPLLSRSSFQNRLDTYIADYFNRNAAAFNGFFDGGPEAMTQYGVELDAK